MKKLHVVVGIPSGQYWNAKFSVDLVNLVSYFANVRVPGFDAQSLQVVNTRSSILPRNRMDLVNTAKKLQAGYLLFLDTDHTFPNDLVHQLLKPELPIVAANCVTKSIPASPTARQRGTDPAGDVVFSNPDSPELEEVWRVGTGVMLVRMDVFDKLSPGCWDMKYLADNGAYQGEDWSFCEACEAAGFPIYVNHKVSQRIGHEGSMVYTHDLVGSFA